MYACIWLCGYILTPLRSRHLFTVKAVIVPIAGLTFFIWCIVKAHGVGPIIHQPSTVHGNALGWNMVASLMSCISNMATLVTYGLRLHVIYSAHPKVPIHQECAGLCLPCNISIRSSSPAAHLSSVGVFHRQFHWNHRQLFITDAVRRGDLVTNRPPWQVSRQPSIARNSIRRRLSSIKSIKRPH